MGRIDIFVGYHRPLTGGNTGVWRPLNARAWTQQIDRALKPRKPAKSIRPTFDPEATSNTPIREPR